MSTYGVAPKVERSNTAIDYQAGWAFFDMSSGAHLLKVHAEDGQLVVRDSQGACRFSTLVRSSGTNELLFVVGVTFGGLGDETLVVEVTPRRSNFAERREVRVLRLDLLRAARAGRELLDV